MQGLAGGGKASLNDNIPERAESVTPDFGTGLRAGIHLPGDGGQRQRRQQTSVKQIPL